MVICNDARIQRSAIYLLCFFCIHFILGSGLSHNNVVYSYLKPGDGTLDVFPDIFFCHLTICYKKVCCLQSLIAQAEI